MTDSPSQIRTILTLAILLSAVGCTSIYTSTDYGVEYRVRGQLVDSTSGTPLAGRRLCLSHWKIPSPYITPDKLTWYVTTDEGQFWAEFAAIVGAPDAVVDAVTLGVQRPDHSWQYQPIALNEQQKKDVRNRCPIDLGTIHVDVASNQPATPE